jgi:hypothetical protein
MTANVGVAEEMPLPISAPPQEEGLDDVQGHPPDNNGSMIVNVGVAEAEEMPVRISPPQRVV